ncbi:uncharacterized protein [Channa argus]|uniref:uncharacterized protein isoform X2 n=1 Tax=Channa argus TaxID=215402 RepID=UPI0029472935|nr:hypothetical protein Q8A73_011183 [Channa argus]
MRNPVTVLNTLLSVEFVLYTMSLCSPQWLVQNEGASEGLFALCTVYKSFSSCTAFAAWLGSYSLSWMFLSASCLLSLTALLTVRPALSRGRKAIAALLLNTTSVVLCASSLINFLVSVKEHKPELQQQLGWSFYICCATLFYASVVTMLLGVIHGERGQVEPALRGGAVDLSVIAAGQSH